MTNPDYFGVKGVNISSLERQNGNVRKIRYENGKTLTFTYNPAGLLIQVSNGVVKKTLKYNSTSDLIGTNHSKVRKKT